MRIVIYYIHCQNVYYTITVFLFQSNCLLATNFNFHIQLSMQPDGVTYDFQTLTIWEFIVWNIGGVWHQLAKIFALEKIIKIIGNKKKTIFIIAPPPYISTNWCSPWTKYRFSYIWWILPPIREYKILLFYSFNSFISSSHTFRYISNHNICIHPSSYHLSLLLVLFRRSNCTVPLPNNRIVLYRFSQI